MDKLISRHEQFNSRMGLRHKFEALEANKAIKEFLPQIVFPRWRYNPDNDNDLEMGRWIWETTKPSLLKVFELLQTADQKARKDNIPTITLNLLKKTHREVRDLKTPKEESSPNSQKEQSQNAYGPHEQQAIARQTGRQRR